MEKYITIKNANAVTCITLKTTKEISIQEAISLRDKLVQKTFRLAASIFYKNDDGNWIIGLRLTPISMPISKLKELGIHIDENKIEPEIIFNEINQYNKEKIDSVLNGIGHKSVNLEFKKHIGDIEYSFEKEIDFKKVIEKQQAVHVWLPDCDGVSKTKYKKREDDFFGNLNFLKTLVDKAQYQGHSGHADFNCKVYPISDLYRDIAKRALLLADEADWFNRYHESKNK